ncbi:ABC transporter of dipeptides [Chlamydia felis Fe/C-56]|uniref:Methionine import ATP-binding protein MetN n=1 Tax=Chlamydia felis (strain Fe/C-56) TaxID=264202 RepID=METN_CHLFF|nr:methionine ABC transporter ATP-binding protein [Chlamydia felis]Q254K9.1 RecName: Full=Methionine import ATP-binding protein MetN [Chlamydia felis Fe/C-56]BAE81279.1 ABC transporter of dipeptides [Chlamydia felis Fe/C-56]
MLEKNPVISVKNLNKEIGNHRILNDISFSVCSGEILGIIGHSGSGKSTLLRCLDFLISPTSGSISIAGFHNSSAKEKISRSDFAKRVAYISQNGGLFLAKTVFENIAYPLKIRYPEMTKSLIEEKVNEALHFLNLYERKHAYPSRLSGGQKQKAAIAIAIVSDPQVLLCDEITSALDPRSTEDITDKLLQLNEERGITQVFVSHEIEVIKKLCTHTLVMHQGNIEELGPADKLFLNPYSSITEELFHMNSIAKGIYDHNENEEILRLGFPKGLAVQGMISQLIQGGQISINILSGDINLFRKIPLGFLIIVLSGEKKLRDRAKDILIGKGVIVQKFQKSR